MASVSMLTEPLMDTLPAQLSSPGVAALKRHLQKTMKRIVTAIPKVREKESAQKQYVASLCNLLEQRQCAESPAVIDNCPLVAEMGPELQAMLCVKLSAEIVRISESLRETLCPMRDLTSVTSKARQEALGLCSQYSLDADTLGHGWPTTPPLLVMLHWLDSANHQLKEQYLSRLHFLDSLTDGGWDNLDVLWQTDMGTLDKLLQDIEEQTRFFLQEKLTQRH